jgi:cytochrome c oxidase assembly protein subunit 11
MPKETVELPVFFYLEPAMLNDRELRGVEKITLSYIFHRSQDNPASVNVSIVDTAK